MSDAPPPPLVFVYNADSSLLSRAMDSRHKAISPATYKCQLCLLTFGAVGMRDEWRVYLDALARPIEFLHRDDAAAHGLDTGALPAVFQRDRDDSLLPLLDSATINKLQSFDELQAALTAALAASSSRDAHEAVAVIIMGVSGAGKTTVGKALATKLNWPFADADDFHPPANVDKMQRSQPLDDADREPWLAALRRWLVEQLAGGRSVVLACSALKQRYRDVLAPDGDRRVRFVYLQGSPDTIARRLESRKGHYMPADLLASQYDALEEPADAVIVDAGQPVGAIVSQVVAALSKQA